MAWCNCCPSLYFQASFDAITTIAGYIDGFILDLANGVSRTIIHIPLLLLSRPC